MNEVNHQIADTWDPIARAEQRMHGGETPLEVYAGCLERAAKEIRCYGRDAGLGLLMGRLVTMFQNSPRSAGEFGKQIATEREACLVGFLREVAR